MDLLPETAITGLLVTVIELVYKTKVKAAQRPRVRDSRTAAQLFLAHWEAGQLELVESMKVLYLNRAGRVLGLYHHSRGGISTTVCDPRLIVTGALMLGAEQIILCHNHPSGDMKPSMNDEAMTKKLQSGCAFFEIKLADHIILCPDEYYSFADTGML